MISRFEDNINLVQHVNLTATIRPIILNPGSGSDAHNYVLRSYHQERYPSLCILPFFELEPWNPINTSV